MKKILIFHFRPIQLYPPIINFLSYIAQLNKYEVTVVTTMTSRFNSLKFNEVKIVECFNYDHGNSLRYLKFYVTCFKYLIPTRKYNVIINYESISSISLSIANLLGLLDSKTKLLFHYHEYFSVHDIKKQMRLEQIGYNLENKILKKAIWVSQTNSHRLNLFKFDKPFLTHNLYSLPNYPSRRWCNSKKIPSTTLDKIKLVFVGALSSSSTYINEIIDWVNKNHDKLSLDIISLKLPVDIRSKMDLLESDSIRYLGPIEYSKLPKILTGYDVGLVIYNGESNNFVYNQPNKIFEYLACGLDVWFSKDLISSHSLQRLDSYPKIVNVDFENIDSFNPFEAVDKTKLNYCENTYYAEEVFNSIFEQIEAN